ncbi:MAG TPA: DNA methyltransferase [Bacteroidales bacterium]|nr:DNA methyltransferase [Bacteroidales bacterium]
MPTLSWIGKEKVINHHREVPFKILEHKYGFSVAKGESEEPVNSGNKIIHGDNLEALKSLLPEYEGKIKCIYIDPPYNTGNENWVYNDNVNHPKIRKWLEATLKAKENGKEAAIGIDDLARHDKWLCMMYPRLTLLYKLLDKDGFIAISIDDKIKIMNQTMEKVAQILNSLDRSELIAVNKMIMHRIKIMDDLYRLAQNSQFQPGQKVSWKDYSGIVRHGRVIKINRKTISVIEDDDQEGIWKVSAPLLTRL